MYEIFDAEIAKSRKPMKALSIIGHWVNDGEVGGTNRFQSLIKINANVFGSATDKRSWEDAIQGKVPPIAWFANNAVVRFLGCNTTEIAQGFAKNYLRGEAVAYGTKMQLWIFPYYRVHQGQMNNTYGMWHYKLWFSKDGKSFDGNFVFPKAMETKFWKGFHGE